ncbi:MAG: hypothetical protein M1817_005950 [Caeruleum heppii]|nr:MAG: hypothetical protein M1817_005950 [Caeruleum heppii]
MSTSAGTKVTNDPQGIEHPIKEGAGTVTSDSLAAESTRQGGGFAANRDSDPSGVPSKSTTANTTDTSSATKLDPAPDAETRQAQEDWQESAQLKGAAGLRYAEGAGGQGQFSGAHSEQGYVGGPSHATKQQQESGSATYNTGSSAGGASHAGVAPTYVEADVIDPPYNSKPKGANLQEGGFDDDASKNASFTSNIGDKNDPGRVAENNFQRQTLQSATDTSGGPRQKNVSGDGQYDSLTSEEQA